MASVIEKVTKSITPMLEETGYTLIQVRLTESAKSRVLQIMAERTVDGSMNLDDCTLLSHKISAILDVEDVISDAYRLEISSPGIDRPLVRLRDYTDYVGFTAKIELHFPLQGRKRFTGTLKGLEGDQVQLEVDGKPVALPFADIASAKLVLTDELIKSHQKKYAVDA
jgi:ribosome maturation factor RimP